MKTNFPVTQMLLVSAAKISSHYHLLFLEFSAGKLLFCLILAGNNKSRVQKPSEEQEPWEDGTSRVFPASPESSTGPWLSLPESD